MITLHKFSDDFCEENYVLIALHSDLEDYALAYALNDALKISLKRSKTDLDISNETSYPIYEWKDKLNERDWTLIINTSIKEEYLEVDDLFSNETSTTVYHILPEYKDVDYLLKIEQEENEADKGIMNSILKIPKIITAYQIETANLKSKQNLII
ncbi:IPExxxVDY family protein [uncultured Eudoraea sp.]|uniref:IPExxxVDY family protein n=1 Tax=uncultured Eudoraea sp. TaxID=1035614 RepID=UPI002637265A|nr:IPExxxVDY family protein [uncultured Eudoraea sp.]